MKYDSDNIVHTYYLCWYINCVCNYVLEIHHLHGWQCVLRPDLDQQLGSAKCHYWHKHQR